MNYSYTKPLTIPIDLYAYIATWPRDEKEGILTHILELQCTDHESKTQKV